MFLKDVGTHYVRSVAGPFVTFIAFFAPLIGLQVWFSWLVAGACLTVAFYSCWRNQRVPSAILILPAGVHPTPALPRWFNHSRLYASMLLILIAPLLVSALQRSASRSALPPSIEIIKEVITEQDEPGFVSLYYNVYYDNRSDKPVDVIVHGILQPYRTFGNDSNDFETVARLRALIQRAPKNKGLAFTLQPHVSHNANPKGVRIPRALYKEYARGDVTLYGVGVIIASDGTETEFCGMQSGQGASIRECPISDSK